MLYPLYTNSQNYNMKKVCLSCGIEFEVYHGNRKYCDDECYYNMKKHRNIISYWNKKSLLSSLIDTEKVLCTLYGIFGERPIEKEYYYKQNINWDIKTGSVQINNEVFDLVGNYGYTFTSNKELKIIYHANNDL